MLHNADKYHYINICIHIEELISQVMLTILAKECHVKMTKYVETIIKTYLK